MTDLIPQDDLELVDNEDSEELYEHFKVEVDPGQSAMRVDKYLAMHVEWASRSRIQAAIESGSVKVNDKDTKASYKIRPRDIIAIVLPKPPEATTIEPENIPLDVFFEDPYVLVINKPPKMVVHPGVGNLNGTLLNALSYYFQNHSPCPPTEEEMINRPGLVHRIDKDTSGLLLIAKTQYAFTHIAKQFYEHTVHRRYNALVWGNVEENEGTIIGNIARDLRDRMRMAIFPTDSGRGKHSVTHYKVLERYYYTTLIECRLETGRTHQIRVHMKSLGHTLFNDKRYGGNEILAGTVFSKYKAFVYNVFKVLPRQALHAKELGFIHPITGDQMMFVSDLPEDFVKGVEKWRSYYHNRRQLLANEGGNENIIEELNDIL
ncbi:MAG: RluA family pseudouridine synthase [Saprospiraceae bacterium]